MKGRSRLPINERNITRKQNKNEENDKIRDSEQT